MGIKKTLGGDRLGSGRKMTQELHGFGRSSHNVSKIMRTDQAYRYGVRSEQQEQRSTSI